MHLYFMNKQMIRLCFKYLKNNFREILVEFQNVLKKIWTKIYAAWYFRGILRKRSYGILVHLL